MSGTDASSGESATAVDRRSLAASLCVLLAVASGVGALAAFEFVYTHPSSWLAALIGGTGGDSRSALGQRVALWLRYGVPALALAAAAAALVRSAAPRSAAAALRFAVPALALWAVVALAVGFGRTPWSGSSDDPRGFAAAYLDHPWPPYGAGAAALLLAAGALYWRVRAGAALMVGLALFAAAQAVRGVLERKVAAGLLNAVPAPAQLDSAATAASAADLVALLALLAGPLLAWTWRHRAPSRLTPRRLLAGFAPLYAAAVLCTYDVPAVAFRDHLEAGERVRAALEEIRIEPLTADEREALRVPRSVAIVGRQGLLFAVDGDRVKAQPRGSELATSGARDVILVVDRHATVGELSAAVARVPVSARVQIGLVVEPAWPERASRAFPLIRAQTFGLAPLRVYRGSEPIPARVVREGQSEPEASVAIDLGKLAPATALQDVALRGDYLIVPGSDPQASQRAETR